MMHDVLMKDALMQSSYIHSLSFIIHHLLLTTCAQTLYSNLLPGGFSRA